MNRVNLKIGDRVFEYPISGMSGRFSGVVVYINPGRFFTVEYDFGEGGTVRESYNFYGPLA